MSSALSPCISSVGIYSVTGHHVARMQHNLMLSAVDRAGIRLASLNRVSDLRQALVFRTTERNDAVTAADHSPAPDSQPANQELAAGAVESSKPPSSTSADSAMTPLVDDNGEAAAPPVAADVSVAAGDQLGLEDAPVQATPDTAEATLDPQLLVLPGLVTPDGDRDEQVRRCFMTSSAFRLPFRAGICIMVEHHFQTYGTTSYRALWTEPPTICVRQISTGICDRRWC